jgi:hypothetical protein
MTERERWRMTLQELCYATKTTPFDLNRWASLGALGPRWREKKQHGRWNHITREAAQRAVIMSRLVDAGVNEEQSATLAAIWEIGSSGDYTVHREHATIVVSTDDLP